MPVYEFLCAECAASREVITDPKTKSDLELLCVHCGGVMTASEVNVFHVVSSTSAAEKSKSDAHHHGTKACGHTHACRCAVKMEKPNPFKKEIDKALGIEIRS